MLSLQVYRTLKKLAKESRFWRAILKEASKPRRVVNVYRLNRYTKGGEVVFVPGKLLGFGNIDHPVTVSAFAFSKSAYEKVIRAGGNVLSMEDFMKLYPKGRGVKIIG
ncbi:MAG: 50S ribosomal protein L18e [Thaumarchaeota archaeon]|jgi:large subunit ribosomal protein L18e|nr:50S ribosomal protein L18e [Candidatus Terraquivivens yellowstonensis]MCL7387417.1 50S ribosomal protein L18e [Candidatus Terraquivivens yellowstonensis]MCL7392075.1 50S ribosomal protein L18e [Candidatus Terraquivivens yellowstonensis]MCL7395037.1 50S ribosomal protein L18e [Candidatus Terraquivivens yellowstonensis]MCL7398234.1 50S ribosomal protein L18e [Candidatus Terraquivivens yellowstonensis]